MCLSVLRYATANNNWIKNYNKNKHLLYLIYLDKKQSIWMGYVSKIAYRFLKINQLFNIIFLKVIMTVVVLNA